MDVALFHSEPYAAKRRIRSKDGFYDVIVIPVNYISFTRRSAKESGKGVFSSNYFLVLIGDAEP